MPERRIATVTQINNYIKALLDQTGILQNVWLKGEISNFKLHSSGHMYLTLKDEGAVLRAVMFRGANANLGFKPENGAQVLARGRVSVYERDGQYQLYIEEMEPAGQGDLYIRFEALKKKLEAEGLFAQNRKKPIPGFPKRIGIVTSETGAALRDILNILRRRYPIGEALIVPCLVQGAGAAESIAAAIRLCGEKRLCDVLIVGRGGGSIEDLWAFNEEIVARAVADCAIPVISAVGHETDFTICDFVADLRAPTPSAAAELAAADLNEVKKRLEGTRTRLAQILINNLSQSARRLSLLSERSGISRFSRRIEEAMLKTDRATEDLTRAFSLKVRENGEKLASAVARLDALSPLAVLKRGYAVASFGGRVIASVRQVTQGGKLALRLADGEIDCSIDRVKEMEI